MHVSRFASRLVGLPGTRSFRELYRLLPQVRAGLATVAPLTSEQIRDASRVPTESTVAGIDPARLALVAEAARRQLGLEVHDEQLVGASALIAGHAIEMDTGEGKTLTGALAAAYLALSGRHVHVLTINDFLARRDAEWMGAVYASLDLDVGWIAHSSTPGERRDAYSRSVLYASVSEVGYDVVRDRVALAPDERVCPVFDVAIVDEADAILIDEAMAPLVLAGELDPHSDESETAARVVAPLDEGRHFVIDADRATVSFTEAGLDLVEHALGGIDLYSGKHNDMLALVNLALHAKALLHRDVDYLVTDGGIRLISASRGRVAELQRWPDGLHAAVEAKEGLPISAQGILLDSMTIQDLVRRYAHVAGMSASIIGVGDDLLEFYGLASGRIRRHVPRARVDAPDVVFVSRDDMLNAAIDAVARLHATGRPVLVGTQSVAESEEIARRLRARRIEPRVLNAKNDAAEAEVIARAGELGAVTVSTQMSGRGTDIVLGGREGADRSRVVELGGLGVVAVGRYPSRRLDAQLRGRSGRQGDPGSSWCFSSLDDELFAAHTPDRTPPAGSAERARLSPRRRRSLMAAAQRVAEAARLERHRSTWAFTRAIAWQRAVTLGIRERILSTDLALDRVHALDPDVIDRLITATFREAAGAAFRRIAVLVGDRHWAEHLAALQELRDVIHLRALAGQDPLDAFHTLALEAFDGWESRLYASVRDAVSAMTPGEIEAGDWSRVAGRPSATWTYMVSDDPLRRR